MAVPSEESHPACWQYRSLTILKGHISYVEAAPCTVAVDDHHDVEWLHARLRLHPQSPPPHPLRNTELRTCRRPYRRRFPLQPDATNSLMDPYAPLMGNPGYDAQHYTVDIAIPTADLKYIEATTTMEAVATADLPTFDLDFLGLDISAGLRGRGRRRVQPQWAGTHHYPRHADRCGREFRGQRYLFGTPRTL